jgi:uncharacterized protein (DUF1499 family)
MTKLKTLLLVFVIHFYFSAEARRGADCPSSPNCVFSLSQSPDHKINPIQFMGNGEDFKNLIPFLVEKMPRVKIVTQEGSFVHLEFTSLIFRFVDDVELNFVEAESVIHIRSASRVGYSDLGANRKRVQEIESLVKQFSVNKSLPH